MKTSYRFTITYESIIDTLTGEILETHIVEKNTPKEVKQTSKDDGSTEPKLILEENKFILNSAAIKFMGLVADDKIDIKYESTKEGSVPVIGTDTNFGTKNGNKLSKSGTVACRGSKNSELSKFGNEFDVVKHPTKEGLFVLVSDSVNIEKLEGDDNVSLDEKDEIPFDLNIDELIDEKDTTEINSSFFQL